ncbi:MAG: nitroreductase family protein, partial [Dehalococcoidia bacterium]|nr:nitroreductase family protein [Dehalococcoidia bacterium]
MIEAVKARRSIRAFKTDPVPRDVLQELIDATRWCPSWENVQPWELAVVGGDKMEELR